VCVCVAAVTMGITPAARGATTNAPEAGRGGAQAQRRGDGVAAVQPLPVGVVQPLPPAAATSQPLMTDVTGRPLDFEPDSLPVGAQVWVKVGFFRYGTRCRSVVPDHVEEIEPDSLKDLANHPIQGLAIRGKRHGVVVEGHHSLIAAERKLAGEGYPDGWTRVPWSVLGSPTTEAKAANPTDATRVDMASKKNTTTARTLRMASVDFFMSMTFVRDNLVRKDDIPVHKVTLKDVLRSSGRADGASTE